jgi:hypothetical protein
MADVGNIKQTNKGLGPLWYEVVWGPYGSVSVQRGVARALLRAAGAVAVVGLAQLLALRP